MLRSAVKSEGFLTRDSKILSAKNQALGGQQQLQIYPDVDHADIIMAVARPFRQKAPVVADVVNFIHAR